jgi:hypothetical protein
MTRASPPVAEVLSLLDRQRDALLRGEFAALDGLDTRLDHALRRLGADRVPAQDLERVGTAAAHVARLLTAARSGVAQVRADRHRAVTSPLMTYDAQGRQHAGPPVGHMLSRR